MHPAHRHGHRLRNRPNRDQLKQRQACLMALSWSAAGRRDPCSRSSPNSRLTSSGTPRASANAHKRQTNPLPHSQLLRSTCLLSSSYPSTSSPSLAATSLTNLLPLSLTFPAACTTRVRTLPRAPHTAVTTQVNIRQALPSLFVCLLFFLLNLVPSRYQRPSFVFGFSPPFCTDYAGVRVVAAGPPRLGRSHT